MVRERQKVEGRADLQTLNRQLTPDSNVSFDILSLNDTRVEMIQVDLGED